eukprot:CAMPEP_0119314566 /NCGR_PEP_ID=MMETSP1333-20130426/33176_1 /TAXON_ID=418940 /ORGANISM="Scyphosphaera apsteinii, Strain RCC1455" /LENGTH=319 /DNA_ID=CAMNT_0007319703 /DNA_START=82 /DNA_END=1041 /DNA_ORIENTATION=-
MAPRTCATPWQADAVVDVGAAITSATSAAPLILTIDRAVVQAMAGTHSLGRALGIGIKDLVTRPHLLLRQLGFWMTAGVYSVTYMAANLIDTVCERKLDPDDPKSAYIHGTAKLVCTTAVNMGAGVAKDAAFARMFGANSSSLAPTPLLTYGLFTCRDVLTISAGFSVPPLVASALSSSTEMDEKKAGAAAQIITPMGMQCFCTPLHLLALNIYNMPNAAVRERVADVGQLMPQATLVRMFRFCAAYGVGGLMNKSLLKHGHAFVALKYAEPDHGVGKHIKPSPVQQGASCDSEPRLLRRRSSVGADGVNYNPRDRQEN